MSGLGFVGMNDFTFYFLYPVDNAGDEVVEGSR